ncbi:hypothetical protein KC992_03810 [Candidatus Saccharibacteria bacterium]|nr:hypothetical protein [Candidatus Saccharibacteria bacterium]
MYYTLTTTTLSFILEGPEQVAALRAKVSIEKQDITEVSYHDAFNDWQGMLVRMPGAYVPRFVMAGSYWTDEGWYFVYARKPRGLRKPILHKVLVITTNRDRYRHLVIETSKENADEILHWWKEKRKK